MTPYELAIHFNRYLGAKYTWWHNGMSIGEDAPFYSRNLGGPVPSDEEIHSKGICCAGLINIGRLVCGLSGLGGTYTYEYGVCWKILRDDSSIPPIGSVLFRKYKDECDQGHLAYVTDTTYIIHACDFSPEETGVIRSSFTEWKNYFTHWAPFEDVFC